MRSSQVRLVGRKGVPDHVELSMGRRILCVSDTHLLPHESPFGDDAPARLLALVERFGDYESVYVLGDVTESLAVPQATPRDYAASPRLRRLFANLAARSDLRVLGGNHDAFAVSALRSIFGSSRVYTKPFMVEGLCFAHGHESGLELAGYSRWLGSVAVPLGVTLRRWLGLSVERLVPLTQANEAIARTVRSGRGVYPVFGHTHTPTVTDGYLRLSYEATRQAASGGVQPNLNLSHVRSIAFPCPPADECKVVAQAIQRCELLVTRALLASDSAGEALKALQSAVLAAAFRGELTER